MSEKFDPDFPEPAGPMQDPYWQGQYEVQRVAEKREFDFRVRLSALDMAVQALPSLSSNTGEETKLLTLKRAAAQFETYLRGEPQS